MRKTWFYIVKTAFTFGIKKEPVNRLPMRKRSILQAFLISGADGSRTMLYDAEML